MPTRIGDLVLPGTMSDVAGHHRQVLETVREAAPGTPVQMMNRALNAASSHRHLALIAIQRRDAKGYREGLRSSALAGLDAFAASRTGAQLRKDWDHDDACDFLACALASGDADLSVRAARELSAQPTSGSQAGIVMAATIAATLGAFADRPSAPPPPSGLGGRFKPWKEAFAALAEGDSAGFKAAVAAVSAARKDRLDAFFRENPAELHAFLTEGRVYVDGLALIALGVRLGLCGRVAAWGCPAAAQRAFAPKPKPGKKPAKKSPRR